MARRNTYSLAPTPSATFRELFDAGQLRFDPAHDRANPAWEQVGYIEIPKLDRTEEFSVWMPAAYSEVTEDALARARAVMDQIAELDTLARQAVADHPADDDEYLAYVQIGEREVALHYYATAWNNEWAVIFGRDEAGCWAWRPDGPRRWYPE